MLKIILRQSSIVIFLKVLTSANALYLTYMISNEFGASTTGIYFFIISLLSFLSSLSTLGLPMSLLSKLPVIADNENKLVKVMMNSLIICFLSSLILMVLLYVFSYIFSHEIISQYFFYISLAIFPFGFILIVSTYFQSTGKIAFAILCLSGGYQFVLTILLLFFPLYRDDESLLNLFLISLISLNFISIFYIFKIPFVRNSISVNSFIEVKRLVFYSVDFMTTNVLGQLSNFFIIFLLSVFALPESLGVYSVALRIALLVSFISFALNKVIAPNISKFYQSARYFDLFKMINISYKITLSLVVPLCLMLIFFSDLILSFFGDEFESASSLLIVLSIGQLIASITGINSFLLQMTGNQKTMQKLTFKCVLISILLDIPLVYFFEALGAATAYSCNLILISSVTTYYVYKKIGYTPLMRIKL